MGCAQCPKHGIGYDQKIVEPQRDGKNTEKDHGHVKNLFRKPGDQNDDLRQPRPKLLDCPTPVHRKYLTGDDVGQV